MEEKYLHIQFEFESLLASQLNHLHIRRPRLRLLRFYVDLLLHTLDWVLDTISPRLIQLSKISTVF